MEPPIWGYNPAGTISADSALLSVQLWQDCTLEIEDDDFSLNARPLMFASFDPE
jgi:hypothetical protein